MAAQIEVEDVEAGAREVVREAARGQVPRVAVLPVAVDEQHRRDACRRFARVRLRTIASGTPRRRRPDAHDHELLDEPPALVAVDGLVHHLGCEDDRGDTLGISTDRSARREWFGVLWVRHGGGLTLRV